MFVAPSRASRLDVVDLDLFGAGAYFAFTMQGSIFVYEFGISYSVGFRYRLYMDYGFGFHI